MSDTPVAIDVTPIMGQSSFHSPWKRPQEVKEFTNVGNGFYFNTDEREVYSERGYCVATDVKWAAPVPKSQNQRVLVHAAWNDTIEVTCSNGIPARIVKVSNTQREDYLPDRGGNRVRKPIYIPSVPKYVAFKDWADTVKNHDELPTFSLRDFGSFTHRTRDVVDETSDACTICNTNRNGPHIKRVVKTGKVFSGKIISLDSKVEETRCIQCSGAYVSKNDWLDFLTRVPTTDSQIESHIEQLSRVVAVESTEKYAVATAKTQGGPPYDALIEYATGDTVLKRTTITGTSEHITQATIDALQLFAERNNISWHTYVEPSGFTLPSTQSHEPKYSTTSSCEKCGTQYNQGASEYNRVKEKV